jgi:hypothetical protein
VVEHPFELGAVYRVRADFQAPRDRFEAGEILVYQSFGQSVYDGMKGYFFRVPGSPAVRPWDLALGDDPGVWTQLFERVADPHPVILAVHRDDPAQAAAAVGDGEPALAELSLELAVQLAAERGSSAVLRALLQASQGSWSPPVRLLHHAAMAGAAESVRALLDAGLAPDAPDVVGQPPLIHAAVSGDVETVALLLSRGADPAGATRSGVTARALALSRHHTEVVALLDRAMAALDR